MRIQNLKAPHETNVPAPNPSAAAKPPGADMPVSATQSVGEVSSQIERQTLEIAFLKARIQHLDLVLETARSLMGSNHERLLRRLHELPREIVELSAQLRRIDPATTW